FLDLGSLAAKMNAALISAKSLIPNPDSDDEFWLTLLSSYHHLLSGAVEEVQRRMKRRKLNRGWLEYLQERTNKALIRFLDDVTPGKRKRPDLSRFPEEFRGAIKRHVYIYALPWEERKDEVSKAWVWFANWINGRLAYGRRIRSKIPNDFAKQVGDPEFFAGL